MESRASRRKAYRAAQRIRKKKARQEALKPPVYVPKKPKVKLKQRIRWIRSDIKYWTKGFIRDLIQEIKDKINPPKRCKLKYIGAGSLCWGAIPAKFYKCRDCGCEFFTSDMSSSSKIALEASSRCDGKKSEEEV